MSIFNPDRAAPVEEEEVPEDLMGLIETKSKDLKNAMLGEICRGLIAQAKNERGRLLEEAVKEFSGTSEKGHAAIAEKLSTNMDASIAKVEASLNAKLSAFQGRVEKALKQPPQEGPPIRQIVHEVVTDALKGWKIPEVPSTSSFQQLDINALAPIVEAAVAKHSAPRPRPIGVNHRRDEYGKITKSDFIY